MALRNPEKTFEFNSKVVQTVFKSIFTISYKKLNHLREHRKKSTLSNSLKYKYIIFTANFQKGDVSFQGTQASVSPEHENCKKRSSCYLSGETGYIQVETEYKVQGERG